MLLAQVSPHVSPKPIHSDSSRQTNRRPSSVLSILRWHAIFIHFPIQKQQIVHFFTIRIISWRCMLIHLYLRSRSRCNALCHDPGTEEICSHQKGYRKERFYSWWSFRHWVVKAAGKLVFPTPGCADAVKVGDEWWHILGILD